MGSSSEKINEVLDTALLQQKIDAGTLELEKYAGYILG
jgi:hypothetical protein